MNKIKRPYSSSGKIYSISKKYLNLIDTYNDIDSILNKYLNYNQNYKYNYTKTFNFNKSNYNNKVSNKNYILTINNLNRYEKNNISPIKSTSNNYKNLKLILLKLINYYYLYYLYNYYLDFYYIILIL